MLRLLLLALLTLSVSCAPSTGPQPTKFDRQRLLTQLAVLPGAVLETEGGIRFSYPEQALFAAGAVLPLPGGTRVLDPLAKMFLANPGPFWQVDVQVATGQGADYDQALAEKRSELLASYLLNKKVDLRKLQFEPVAASEDALVFRLNLSQVAEKL